MIMFLDKEQIKAITAPIDPAALKQITGKGGAFTAINGYYIVERLNEVYGIGEWSWDVEIVRNTDFQAVVKGTITLPNGTKLSQFGGSKHQVKQNQFDKVDVREVDLGDLIKGAATNALSKVSSYLGIGGEIYGMKYKSKQKNSNSSSSTQTSTPQAKKDNRKQVLIDDKFTEDRVKNLVVLVKKENSGKAILYGKGKNKFYTNDSIYTLSPNQLLKVIENYGATVSG